ncbi:MAG TPA: hypothetical protein VLM84_11965 [Chromatiaceae bacterium]|nr:hypothetical protein [Chromatiaceae bacterium]
MQKSITEIATAASGAILAISGVLAAIGTLQDEAGSVLDGLGIAQVPWVPWALIALLVLSGLWLLGRGLSRKSRLLRPERLLIDPDNPDHQRGRVTEVGRLRDAVTARPLVLLEGESGCGKSARSAPA